MRHVAAALFLFSLATGASAFPPIVLYNYAAPLPSLELVSISPLNHQEMKQSPPVVKVSFTQAIDQSNSDLKVFDPYNNLISGEKDISKDTAMSVAVPPNQLAGAYRIQWSAVCACSGHASINGTSYFSIY